MNANAILDTLNTVLDAIIGALSVALQASARAALANVPAAEWVLALVLAFAAWMLAGRRGSLVLNLLLFVLGVGASAWLSWRTHHHGVLTQQVVLAALSLHGLKSRGWALLKKGA